MGGSQKAETARISRRFGMNITDRDQKDLVIFPVSTNSSIPKRARAVEDQFKNIWTSWDAATNAMIPP
jgi:hypothetical protein